MLRFSAFFEGKNEKNITNITTNITTSIPLYIAVCANLVML